MAKAMTKSQIAEELAEKLGIQKKQAVEYLAVLAEMAYREAKNAFTMPGIGKLVLVDRAARMGRNPQTGEPISIPASFAESRTSPGLSVMLCHVRPNPLPGSLSACASRGSYQ